MYIITVVNECGQCPRFVHKYWHDVGRIQYTDGHEKLSAEMLNVKESDIMLELEENSKLLQELQKTLPELGESL